MADVFISYKREDQPRVEPLQAALRSSGLDVWWDQQIASGDQWRQRILAELGAAKCVLAIWSHASTGPEGYFVLDEATRANRRGVLLQVRIDDVPLPLGFGEFQALDLINWKGDLADPKFRDVLAAVENRLAHLAIPPPQLATTRRFPLKAIASITVAAIAICAATVEFTHRRSDIDFQASVQTQAVDFTVGTYKKAGPFVGGCVDAYMGSVGKAELPLSKPETLWGGKIRFRNVDFRGLLLTAGTQVRIVWYQASPSGVEMILTYKQMPGAAVATVFLNEASVVEFQDSGLTKEGATQSGVIGVASSAVGMASIYPTEDLRFPISITPCPDRKSALPDLEEIPLAKGSAIRFLSDDGESAIFGSTNTLNVGKEARTEAVSQRLDIFDLKERSAGSPSQIALRIQGGIKVDILGRAGRLRVDTKDVRPSLMEFWRTNW